MIGNYRRLPQSALDAVLQNPSEILDFLYPEARSIPDDQEELDIDKSWQAIHFLLNGNPWDGSPPQFNVVLGGHIIGDEDVGYGPARYLTPVEVQQVTTFLDSLSDDDLVSSFDVNAFREQEIYPSGWEGSQEEEKYIKTNFNNLKAFFERAETRQDAVIIYLN